MTQQVVSVVEMTLLYGARYSFVLLKLKHKVKLLPQSAEKWICMRKFRDFIYLRDEEAPDERTFLS